jgi:hypothetical protein
MANAGTTPALCRRICSDPRAAPAGGDTDIAELDRQIGALGARQFLLHSAKGGAPRRFTTRWAMSFLRGPLTRAEIEKLTADDPDRAAAAAQAEHPAGAAGTSPAQPEAAVPGENEVTLADASQHPRALPRSRRP